MALRFYGDSSVNASYGMQSGRWATRVWGDGASSLRSSWRLLPAVKPNLRPNNDGPGWTRNRFTQPSKEYPIPVKVVVSGGGNPSFMVIPVGI